MTNTPNFYEREEIGNIAAALTLPTGFAEYALRDLHARCEHLLFLNKVAIEEALLAYKDAMETSGAENYSRGYALSIYREELEQLRHERKFLFATQGLCQLVPGAFREARDRVLQAYSEAPKPIIPELGALLCI